MTKRICIVTGTRADYGLLRWAMEGIRQSPVLELQLIATGMHLSPEFGLTVEAIESDGFQVDRKVEMLLSSDTAVGVTKSTGLGLIGFADALAELRPDLRLVLGDDSLPRSAREQVEAGRCAWYGCSTDAAIAARIHPCRPDNAVPLAAPPPTRYPSASVQRLNK
jgi:hypothetical protein